MSTTTITLLSGDGTQHRTVEIPHTDTAQQCANEAQSDIDSGADLDDAADWLRGQF